MEAPSRASVAKQEPAGRLTRYWTVLERIPVAALVLLAVKYRGLDNTIVRQHDNLDQMPGLLDQLSFGDLFAAPGATIPYLLGGLPRGLFGSEFYLSNIIGVGLPLYWSLLVTELIVRVLAFYGMRSLLRTAGLGERRLIVYGVATIYSLLPFFMPAFGAIAAAPFLVAAVIRALETGRLDRGAYFVFALFPLIAPSYATIPYTFLLALVAILLYPILRSRAVPLLRGAAVMGLSVLIVDWRLIWENIAGEPTHRAEIGREYELGLSRLADVPGMLSTELSHVWMGKSLVLALVFAIAIILLIRGWRRIDRQLLVIAGALVGVLVIGALFEIVWYPFEVEVIGRLLDDWGRFQLERIRWIEPAIIYLLVAIALSIITDLLAGEGIRRQLVTAFIVLSIAVQSIVVVSAQRFLDAPTSLTIGEFYAFETMSEISDAIDADNGIYSVSIGIHPAVAIASGIESADGYWSTYPLEYKRRFRSLIAPALDQMTDEDRIYFDRWGSRAYVFQPDLKRPSASYAPKDGELELLVDPAAYDDLGITHVISSVLVVNADAVGLELMLEIDNPSELGTIRLYRIT
ncbi:MAG: DUF6044 family protein [Acidimicrobiia bacterium]|nr:DUF6044 family protein [Acidimicrobiia bacterium]